MSEFLNEWQDFNNKVIAPEAGDTQRKEMKMAFFAGAATLFALQMEIANKNLPEREEFNALEAIRQEIYSFKPE